jgi:hypothetical protein
LCSCCRVGPYVVPQAPVQRVNRAPLPSDLPRGVTAVCFCLRAFRRRALLRRLLQPHGAGALARALR